MGSNVKKTGLDQDLKIVSTRQGSWVISDLKARMVKWFSIGSRNKLRVETQGSSSQLIKENSLPKDLSSLEDIQFDLSFEISLFRTKS